MKTLTSFSISLAVMILGFAISGRAQAAEVRGPVLGHVMDPVSKTVRPMLGIAGAASIGESIDLGFTVQQAVMIPERDLMVAVRIEDGEIVVAHGLSGSPAIETIANLARTPDRFVSSIQGTAAAFLYRDSRTLAVVSQLHAQPYVSRQVDLQGFNGGVADFAVSDEGDVLLAVDSGADGAVYLVSTSGEPRFLFATGRTVSLAFARNGRDALVADRDLQTVRLLHEVAANGFGSEQWTSADGVEDPVAIRVDGTTHVLVANASGSIVDIDLQSSQAAVFQCGCNPTQIEALAVHSVFRLTGGGTDSPIYLYDRSRSAPRVVLIPPRNDSNFLDRR